VTFEYNDRIGPILIHNLTLSVFPFSHPVVTSASDAGSADFASASFFNPQALFRFEPTTQNKSISSNTAQNICESPQTNQHCLETIDKLSGCIDRDLSEISWDFE
jgi:hypothetical protein